MKRVFMLLFLIVLIGSMTSNQAFAVDFNGKLDVVEFDNGCGRYSGKGVGINFFGSISETCNGFISDGTTRTDFGCCIAAGCLSIENNVEWDGEVVDVIQIEGDARLDNGNRIEIGLTYLLDPDAFSDTNPDNFPPKPEDIKVSVFFIFEEDFDGHDCYSVYGELDQDPMAQKRATVNGTVGYNGETLCAMVLANGQYMFTCKAGDDFGQYELDVPLDANDEITIQAFVSGLAPFRQTTDESDLTIDIEMQTADPESLSPDVTTVNQSDASTPANWARITGTVASGGTSLCAMVLANGQYMFSCGVNDGTYDLTVPLDSNDEITHYVFVSGFKPYKRTFAP